MTRCKELVSYSWKPLSPEASIFPPTHTHTHTTSYVNIGNLLYIRVQTNPSLVENPVSRGRRDKFWIVSSRLRPYSDFSKHSRKSHTVASTANQFQGQISGSSVADCAHTAFLKNIHENCVP